MPYNVRKSPIDNLWRRWELRPASALGVKEKDARRDYLKWVIVGVFPSRRKALRGAPV